MKIGIIGIAGRMGQLLAEETRSANYTLVGGTLRPNSAKPTLPATPIFPNLSALAEASDAVIDFTIASAVAAHAETLTETGTPWVLGTSGLNANQETIVQQAASSLPVVYAANFSPGINLILDLAERMAASLPAGAYDAEIVEMHHRQKVDAPSGTAVGLGRAVALGRGVDLADVAESGRDGHAGPRAPGAIGFAAIRGGQVVGEHTLLFAGASEHIALSHRVFDRRIFATGAVRAAAWLRARPPGLYSMRDVMAA